MGQLVCRYAAARWLGSGNDSVSEFLQAPDLFPMLDDNKTKWLFKHRYPFSKRRGCKPLQDAYETVPQYGDNPTANVHPDRDGSGTTFLTYNGTGTPMHPSGVVINNHNSLGVSLLGKEVVGMGGGNDERRFTLTMPKGTTVTEDSTIAESQQRGFMDTNLNHRALRTDAEKQKELDEDKDKIFCVSCKVLMLYINTDNVPQNDKLLNDFNYDKDCMEVLKFLYGEAGSSEGVDLESWFCNTFSARGENGENTMTNLSELRNLCYSSAVRYDDENSSIFWNCGSFFDEYAINNDLNNKMLMDIVMLLSDIDDINDNYGIGIIDGGESAAMEAYTDEKEGERAMQRVRVVTSNDKNIEGDVLLKEPLVIRMDNGKFVVFQNNIKSMKYI
jgi:hypothetical protein